MDLNFELESNPRVKIELWNQSVQVWLKKCVYIRVYRNNPKRANIAMFATFFVSAFWHGFYLAYYIAFIQFALVNNVTKFLYKAAHKFEPINGWALAAFTWIISTVTMSFIGGSFLLLLTEKVWAFYINFYFAVPIGLVLTYVFFTVTQWGQRSVKGSKNN